MLINTPEFKNKFIKDISEIALLYKIPLDLDKKLDTVSKFGSVFLIGSFKHKKYGSFVTDIDLESYIDLDYSLLKQLVSNINKSKNFTFIRLYTGTRHEINFPWDILSDYNCKFNLQEVEKWFEKMKDTLPVNTFTEINKIFTKSSLSVKDLYAIENIIKSYNGISWTRDDINQNYKDFSDVMLKKNQVKILKFLYKYQDNYCLVDYAISKKINTSLQTDINNYEQINHYFKSSIYKLINLRYYLSGTELEEYRKQFSEKISPFTTFLANHEMLEKIVKYKVLPENEITRLNLDLENYKKSLGVRDIYKEINERSDKLYLYFKDRVDKQYIVRIGLLDIRSRQVSVQINKNLLNFKNGICPFYIYPADTVKKIIELAHRAKIDLFKFFNCLIRNGVVYPDILFTKDILTIEKKR